MNLFREKMLEKPRYMKTAAWGLTLLCVCTAFVLPLYSGDVDNYTMALVANKLFAGESQDVYISYLHPFLSKIMECIHNLMPAADCFTLTANLMLFGAIWWIGYAISHIVNNYWELAGSYTIVYIIVLIQDLFHYNFTRWAAFLSAAGALILLLVIHRKLYDKKWIIIASILLSLGMMWRYEVLLIFVPYILFDFIIQIFFGEKKAKEKCERFVYIGKMIGLPLICMALLFASDWCVRNSETYREAIAYDDARSAVVDYPIKVWEEVKEQLPNISKNDYESVYGWIFMDTDRIDADYFSEMKEAGEKRAYSLSVSGMINMQKRVLSVFLESYHLQYLCLLAGLMLLLILLSDIAWYYKAESLLLLIGTDLIYLFFAYMGRGIERVYIAALYALLISVGVLVLVEVRQQKKRMVVGMKKVMVSVACIGILYELGHADFTLSQSVFRANKEMENAYLEFCKEDELYFWRVGQYVQYPVQTFMGQGKLMPKEVVSHHMYDGAWVYGQVYFEQFLEKVNAKNPMEALLERDNTYYVASDCNYVLTYLQENYDAGITATQVKEIDGIPVWEFSVIKE